MELKWRELETRCRCFWRENEPWLIHVIKTGFNDEYIIVHEDGEECIHGKSEIMTEKELKEKYNIEL